MSRSRRKNPIRGFTSAESEKDDKRLGNRRLRHAERIAIQSGNVDNLPCPKVKYYQWMSKDGKGRFDPTEHPDLMRK